MQLPCVGGVSLWKGLMAPPDNPSAQCVQGSALFSRFAVFQLTEMMRARGDSRHQENLMLLRGSHIRPPNVVVDGLRAFSEADVLRDPAWCDHSVVRVIVTTNRMRARANAALSVEYARAQGRLVLAWRLPFTPETERLLTGASRPGASSSAFVRDEFCALFPELTVYFVEGAPCQILSNFSPGRGVANGSAAFFYGLVLDAESRAVVDAAVAAGAAPGTVVLLPRHPISVLVDFEAPAGTLAAHLFPLPASQREALSPMSVVSGRVVMAIPPVAAMSAESVQNPPAGFTSSSLKYKEAAVDANFACTVWKAQVRPILPPPWHMHGSLRCIGGSLVCARM